MIKTTKTINRTFLAGVSQFSEPIHVPFQPDEVVVKVFNTRVNPITALNRVESTLPLRTLDGVIAMIPGDTITSGLLEERHLQCLGPVSGDYTFYFSTPVEDQVGIVLEFIKYPN